MKPNQIVRNIKICWIKNEIHPFEQYIIDFLEKSTVKLDSGFLHDISWLSQNIFMIRYYNDSSNCYIDLDLVRNYTKQKTPDLYLEPIKLLLEKHLNIKINNIDFY